MMASSPSCDAAAAAPPVGESAEALLCGERARSGAGPRGDSVETEEAPPGDMAAMAESGDSGADGVWDRWWEYLLGN